MDKRTRVLNAMNKQPVDHVPVGMWYHFPVRTPGEKPVYRLILTITVTPTWIF